MLLGLGYTQNCFYGFYMPFQYIQKMHNIVLILEVLLKQFVMPDDAFT